MPENKILKHYGKKSQLKRLGVACGKLACASGEFKATGSPESLKYLAKKIANVEFLHDQIKETYKLGESVFNHKYELQSKLEKAIKQSMIEKKDLLWNL